MWKYNICIIPGNQATETQPTIKAEFSPKPRVKAAQLYPNKADVEYMILFIPVFVEAVRTGSGLWVLPGFWTILFRKILLNLTDVGFFFSIFFGTGRTRLVLQP